MHDLNPHFSLFGLSNYLFETPHILFLIWMAMMLHVVICVIVIVMGNPGVFRATNTPTWANPHPPTRVGVWWVRVRVLWGSWVIVGLAGSKIPYQIPRT
jgi:hypothetical protein